MTTDNFRFYLQNRLIQTGQTGGQWYSDTSPFSIPWFVHLLKTHLDVVSVLLDQVVRDLGADCRISYL